MTPCMPARRLGCPCIDRSKLGACYLPLSPEGPQCRSLDRRERELVLGSKPRTQGPEPAQAVAGEDGPAARRTGHKVGLLG